MAPWIKMPLGRKVGLDPSNIVLNGEPALLPKKGQSSPPIFGPCLLCPNSWMDQDATCCGGRPQPRPQCAGWGRSSSAQKGGHTPNFGPCLLCQNGWMEKDATWYEGRPRPKRHCVRSVPSSPSPKKGAAPPSFGPMTIVAKRLHGSRCHFVWR